MGRTILVTGGGGFAGSHLLDLLAAGGGADRLVGWARPGGHAPREVPGVEWDAVDMLDRGAVAAALGRRPPSLVYHLAGAAHVGQSWAHITETLAINVRGTHFLLDALRRQAIRARVVVASSAMVYEPLDRPLSEEARLLPPTPYGLSKLAQEMLGADAIDDGIEVLLARPFNHFGPRQASTFAAASFARQVAEIEAGRQPPEIVVGNLEARRDLTDVRDVAAAYRLLGERAAPARPYNICTGHAVAIQEVLDGVLARARVPVRVRVDPARYQPNDRPVLVGDGRRIRDELGWTPAIPFDKTLDDLLDYWRAR